MSARRGVFSRIASGVRRAAREFLLDETWKGTNTGRLFYDWITMGGLSADDELRGNARLLRARARDLARNNPFVRKYLGLLTTGVVGPNGFRMRSQIRDRVGDLDKTANDTHEAAWRRWASGPVDTTGKLTLVDLEGLLVRSIARDGEAFVRIWKNFKGSDFGVALEVIDAELVDDSYNRAPLDGRDERNEISMGIELDRFGAPVAYHVLKRAGSIGVPRGRMVIPAGEMLHLYLVERPGQNRGVTWLASVMTDLKMLAGYFEAELVASRAASAKMGFWQRKDGPAESPGDITLDANPGVIDFGPEGYEFAQWDPQHPTTAFPEFTGAILRSISAGLRVGYASLTGDLREANYGSQRGGLLEERDFYRETQAWFSAAFHRRVHPVWCELALLKGSLPLEGFDPTPYLDVSWHGRGYAWIDPKNDVESIVLACNNGLGSRTNALLSQGLDPEEVFEQLAGEKEMADRLGVDLAPAALPGANATTAPSAKAGEGGGGGDGEEPDGGRAASHINGNGAPRRLVGKL